MQILEGNLSRGSENAAGWDLCCLEEFSIDPREIKLVPTGVKVAISQGHYGKIEGRSSLARRGIGMLAGVVDCDYRGEIGVVMVNHGFQPIKFEAGHRIAQLIEIPCLMPSAVDTARGEGGFGSTGK